MAPHASVRSARAELVAEACERAGLPATTHGSVTEALTAALAIAERVRRDLEAG